MRHCPRQRHAVARELPQCDERQIRPRHAHTARRRAADATHQNCRSSPGATKSEDRADSFGETFPGNCRPVREARTNDFVFESARILHLAALQQLRQGAQLSELQRCPNLSSPHGKTELPSLRTHRGGAEKMSRLRPGRTDLRRIWNGKGGVARLAVFSEGAGAAHASRFNDPEGGLTRSVAEFSLRKNRNPGWDPNDRERFAFSKRYPGRNHQRRSRVASSRFPCGRTNIPAVDPSRRTRRARRNARRSFCPNLHSVLAIDPVRPAPRFL